MKKEVKTLYKKMTRISGILFIAMSLSLASCSDDDNSGGSNVDLITKHDLPGTYSLEISPSFMGNTPISAGTHQGIITDEGNGVLRLKFGGFNAPPMPFVMSIDVKFTLTESGQVLNVHNVDGKGFFNANVPPGQTIDPSNLPPGIELPDGALQNGLHSEGNSSVSGKYLVDQKVFELQIDPAVGLPIIVNVKTLEKLD